MGPDATKGTPAKRVKLDDLTDKEKQSLIAQAIKLVEKGKAPKGGRYNEVKYEGETYMIGQTVKYLHRSIRFDTMNSKRILGFSAGPPPIRAVKPLSNPSITRVFVGLAKDAAKNKNGRNPALTR